MTLSPREREVLQHAARGLSDKAIAKELRVAEQTVKTHMAKVRLKVGISQRLPLVLRAIQLGLIVQPQIGA